MKRTYFSMTKAGQTATINIYGDITSFPWLEGDVSAVNLSKQLETLGDVTDISVYINSYGGEVAEGLAIYNALRRHKAKVTTYCDGFAASIASVIFMAGDERVMNDASLLMIHNAWSCAMGNAQELRKQADDLEKITQASVVAYKAHSSLSEEEIKSLMDAESWILPEEALQYGFATSIEKSVSNNASQNARMSLVDIIKQHNAEMAEEDDTEDTGAEDDEGEETPETPEEPNQPEVEAEDEPETPEDEEPTGDEEETPEDTEDEEQEEAAQRWSGFFNALLKL